MKLTIRRLALYTLLGALIAILIVFKPFQRQERMPMVEVVGEGNVSTFFCGPGTARHGNFFSMVDGTVGHEEARAFYLHDGVNKRLFAVVIYNHDSSVREVLVDTSGKGFVTIKGKPGDAFLGQGPCDIK